MRIAALLLLYLFIAISGFFLLRSETKINEMEFAAITQKKMVIWDNKEDKEIVTEVWVNKGDNKYEKVFFRESPIFVGHTTEFDLVRQAYNTKKQNKKETEK